MIRWLIITAMFVQLAACSTSGKPLPLVDKSDPTWALAPDHLDYGALPR